MLVDTFELLTKAKKEHYAIAAFNVENLEFIMAVTQAAEDLHAPIILQTTPGTISYANCAYFASMCKVAAEQTNVPIALHLDHGDSKDTCIKAMRAGYTSIMIDASSFNLNKNIELTSSITEIAHPIHLPVEAEIGQVGGKEDTKNVDEYHAKYTDPEEAALFVEKTRCDSLAIAIGTAHGIYKETPHIQQNILKSIASMVDVPLVLHGTSGVADEQVALAVKNGICKVNYATELRQAFSQGCKNYIHANPDCFDPKKPNREGMKEIYKVAVSHIKNLGSANKA